MNTKFDRDVFLVNQKFMSLGKSKFVVYDEGGTALFYAERPTMRLFGRRAPITLFDDEAGTTPVLVAEQDHGWELLKREYTLVDAQTKEPVAHLRRDNIRSLFKRAWRIEDPSGELIAVSREDSTFMAVLRRVVDFIPFLSIIGFAVLKTDFHIFTVANGNERKAGSFNRKIALGDKYVLSLKEDPERQLDRRTAVMLGLLLDTAEAR